MLSRIRQKSEFSGNVITLMVGTAAAQAIPIAISPVLTRIYTPEEFGVFALFMAVVLVFSTIINARYELAITLPERDGDAVNIAALGLLINSVVSLFIALIVVLFNSDIASILGNKDIGSWLYLMPVAIFVTGFFNVVNYANTRLKNYKEISKSNVVKSIILAVLQIVVGLMKPGVGGLIVGQITATSFADFQLLKKARSGLIFVDQVSWTNMYAVAKRYSDFPKYSLWAALANTLSKNLIMILISLYYSTTMLGFYSLVYRVLSMPITLIGRSIGQVFYQKASVDKRECGTAIRVFTKTLQGLLIIGFFPFLFLFLIAEDIFGFVFGDAWRVAGQYAQILIPLFYVRFVVSPLTTMNQVNKKNKLGMIWQFGLLLITVGVFAVSEGLDVGFESFLKAYVAVVSVYYIYFLWLIYRHVKKTDL